MFPSVTSLISARISSLLFRAFVVKCTQIMQGSLSAFRFLTITISEMFLLLRTVTFTDFRDRDVDIFGGRGQFLSTTETYFQTLVLKIVLNSRFENDDH